MKKHTVYGEYEQVAKHSRDITRLDEVHSIPITRKEAEDILTDVCAYLKVRRPKLSFGAKYGKAYHNDYRISLPSSGWCKGFDRAHGWKRYGTLRVGLVLHELAHLLTPIKRTATGRGIHHGADFTRNLDTLIEVWYKLLETRC